MSFYSEFCPKLKINEAPQKKKKNNIGRLHIKIKNKWIKKQFYVTSNSGNTSQSTSLNGVSSISYSSNFFCKSLLPFLPRFEDTLLDTLAAMADVIDLNTQCILKKKNSFFLQNVFLNFNLKFESLYRCKFCWEKSRFENGRRGKKHGVSPLPNEFWFFFAWDLCLTLHHYMSWNIYSLANFLPNFFRSCTF